MIKLTLKKQCKDLYQVLETIGNQMNTNVDLVALEGRILLSNNKAYNFDEESVMDEDSLFNFLDRIGAWDNDEGHVYPNDEVDNEVTQVDFKYLLEEEQFGKDAFKSGFYGWNNKNFVLEMLDNRGTAGNIAGTKAVQQGVATSPRIDGKPLGNKVSSTRLDLKTNTTDDKAHPKLHTITTLKEFANAYNYYAKGVYGLKVIKVVRGKELIIIINKITKNSPNKADTTKINANKYYAISENVLADYRPLSSGKVMIELHNNLQGMLALESRGANNIFTVQNLLKIDNFLCRYAKGKNILMPKQ